MTNKATHLSNIEKFIKDYLEDCETLFTIVPSASVIVRESLEVFEFSKKKNAIKSLTNYAKSLDRILSDEKGLEANMYSPDYLESCLSLIKNSEIIYNIDDAISTEKEYIKYYRDNDKLLAALAISNITKAFDVLFSGNVYGKSVTITFGNHIGFAGIALGKARNSQNRQVTKKLEHSLEKKTTKKLSDGGKKRKKQRKEEDEKIETKVEIALKEGFYLGKDFCNPEKLSMLNKRDRAKLISRYILNDNCNINPGTRKPVKRLNSKKGYMNIVYKNV